MSCCSACGAHACACGCGAPARTPLAVYNRPGLDAIAWRVGTYGDFHATMQADLSSTAYPALAGLRTREADDPAMALIEAGSNLVLATPNGTNPHIDEASDSVVHFGGDQAAYSRAKAFWCDSSE